MFLLNLKNCLLWCQVLVCAYGVPRFPVIRSDSPSDPASANTSTSAQNYDLPTLVAQGINACSQGLHNPPGLGLVQILLNAKDSAPFHTAYEMAKIRVIMSTPSREKYWLASNTIPPHRAGWGGPWELPSDLHTPEVRLWQWSQRGTISVQRAMDLLARFGRGPPWDLVDITFPTNFDGTSLRATEPSYRFAKGGSQALWIYVGMVTGRIGPINPTVGDPEQTTVGDIQTA